MTKLTPEALANDLIGSSRALTVEEQEAMLETNFAPTFDLLCFECECCGWWFSTDDLVNHSGVNHCEDCDTARNLQCTD